MTDFEYKLLQQKKYYGNHRQYKVYLETEKDAEIIRILDRQKNRSAFIREALISFQKGKTK